MCCGPQFDRFDLRDEKKNGGKVSSRGVSPERKANCLLSSGAMSAAQSGALSNCMISSGQDTETHTLMTSVRKPVYIQSWSSFLRINAIRQLNRTYSFLGSGRRQQPLQRQVRGATFDACLDYSYLIYTSHYCIIPFVCQENIKR